MKDSENFQKCLIYLVLFLLNPNLTWLSFIKDGLGTMQSGPGTKMIVYIFFKVKFDSCKLKIMAKNRISTSFFENEGHNGRIEASIVDVWSIRSPNTIPMFFEVFFS